MDGGHQRVEIPYFCNLLALVTSWPDKLLGELLVYTVKNSSTISVTWLWWFCAAMMFYDLLHNVHGMAKVILSEGLFFCTLQ